MIDLATRASATHSPKASLPTVFVSDVHLGSRYCRAERFLWFLQQHEIQELYLVGDIVDGWRLKQRWWWPPVYHQILRQLISMASAGTRIYYTPGNHDEFLRNYLLDFGFVEVKDQFVYESRRGQRMLVMHGDQFDCVESKIPWLSMIGAGLYETLMGLNYCVNRARGWCGWSECQFSSTVKQSVKRAVKFMSDFEQTVADYARQQRCDGIICGHIHAPAVTRRRDVVYCNTGDWVEHCTALIEHADGRWELRDFHSTSEEKIVGAFDGKDLLQHVGRGAGACGASGRDRRPDPTPA